MNGYVNGDDLLMKVSTGAIGHCTTHSATYNTEAVDTAVKPLASAAPATGLFKGKRIKGLSVQVKASGLKFYSETESGFKVLVGKWALGQSVPVALFERSQDANPYLTGNFIITTLVETNPSKDDGSYDVTLDNDGDVAVDADKIDLLASPSL